MRLQNGQLMDTKRSLEKAVISLATQTDDNRQLRDILDAGEKKIDTLQKASTYYEQAAKEAKASNAQLSAEAERKVHSLNKQLDVVRQECTAVEKKLHASQKLSEQYFQELQDSEAVLARTQKEAQTAGQLNHDRMMAARQSYQRQLADLEKQVEASTAMLNEQTSTRELTISKLEIRISDLESQLVAQTEEEKMKLERLVKETGEASRLEASLAERVAESEHLRAQKTELESRCEAEIREKDGAMAALEDRQREAAEEAKEFAAQSAALRAQNEALQNNCALLESQLTAAKRAASENDGAAMDTGVKERAEARKRDSAEAPPSAAGQTNTSRQGTKNGRAQRHRAQQLPGPSLRPRQRKNATAAQPPGDATERDGHVNKKRKKNLRSAPKAANRLPDSQRPCADDHNVEPAHVDLPDKALQQRNSTAINAPEGGGPEGTHARLPAFQEEATEPIEGSHEDLFAVSIFGDFGRNQLIAT
eukprot:jgi/Tetstr1/458254/TSEL_044742.t1